MASKLKITKNLPSYLEKSSKGGLLIGFIYVIAFMSILFLAIWQTFESENNKLWDLSNKRNKVDILKLTEQTNEIENLLLTIRNDIEINQKNLLSTQDSVSKNIKKIDDLGLSSEDLISLKLSLNNIDTQLILLDDSVQALNNYRNQLNQVILEIQTQISSVQNSLNSDKVVQN